MKLFLPLVLHVAPLVPLFFGHPYGAVALLLFVLLCYIKVFKLRQQLLDLAAQGGDPKQEVSIQNALHRWLALTFLKRS